MWVCVSVGFLMCGCVTLNYLFTEIGFLLGGCGYFTCKQNMKMVTTRFKLGGLHEKHVVATWNVGKKNLCRGGQSQDLPNTVF